MKLLLLPGLAVALALCGCGTFNGAGEDAVENLDQGLDGRGRLISPNQMGDRFGAYYE